MYLGGDPGAREDGGRFDLPPYQVQIKTRARDLELPGLAFNVDKREISFGWEGMFQWFFSETTMLANEELKIMIESMRWHEEAGNLTVSGTLAHTKKRDQALRNATGMVRRHRIRKYYKDNHNWVYKDSMFDEGEEDKALDAIEKFELHGDFTRGAEDKEAREKAERHVQAREMFDVMKTMRGIQGVAEG
jgi:hypothetical protein